MPVLHALLCLAHLFSLCLQLLQLAHLYFLLFTLRPLLLPFRPLFLHLLFWQGWLLLDGLPVVEDLVFSKAKRGLHSVHYLILLYNEGMAVDFLPTDTFLGVNSEASIDKVPSFI